MALYNPPHPGEFIQVTYMEPLGLSCRALAAHLQVAASTLHRILQGRSGISPEMALRLAKVLGRSPESWLAMQNAYDLWTVRKTANLATLRLIDFATS